MLNYCQLFGAIVILCLLIYFNVPSWRACESVEIREKWLDLAELKEADRQILKDGITSISGCCTPEEVDRLPELPEAEQRRVRQAAQLLQQRLVLRQWLATHRLQYAYSRLVSVDVSTLEDVYWLEDSRAMHLLDPKDLNTWSMARQSLPTGKEQLQTLKADLWSAVVKNSRHQDAWTWGGMLVVSASVAGLVTLAAMTQPSLAPEAKHSLLQYVTGKYLQPSSCKVEWGWEEPQTVGETMCFDVLCYQRNGQPYPICDADELTVSITHATRKMTPVIELGSNDPSRANRARVQFTVRAAGVYIVSVMIGGAPIGGSPYRCIFVAGPVSGSRSRAPAFRAPRLCQRGQRVVVPLLPRDRHDNVTPHHLIAMEGFNLTISKLGGSIDKELSQSAEFSAEAQGPRVLMSLALPAPGLYRAELRYGDELLVNGQFDCVVLNEVDYAKVQRETCSKKPHAHYEATLVGSIGQLPHLSGDLSPSGAGSPEGPLPPKGAKGRRLVCCLSPTAFVIKDYWLNFIPKRLATFRLKPNTKLTIKPIWDCSDSLGAGSLVVEDGVQAGVELRSRHRDMILAAVSSLLSTDEPDQPTQPDDCFKNKAEQFYAEMRKAHARHSQEKHEKLAIRVSRADLLASSYRATKHLSASDWCKNFDLSFEGEQGVDWGGVRREWFSLLCGQLFDAGRGLFRAVAPGTSPHCLVQPNPDRPPHLKLKHVEMAGKVVGKCLYESAQGGSYRQLVRARFARSLLAHMIGLRVTHKHFEHDDPELYMCKIKYVLDNDMEAENAPEVYFTDDVFDNEGRFKESRELVPNGAHIRVTNNNKMLYVEALAQWRLSTRIRAELSAFLRGLHLLVPRALLAPFDEHELELLVCGSGELCVSDWRAHTALGSGAGRGWRRSVAWFWAAVAAFSAEERKRLLHFATGSSQLPPQGFQELNPRFQLCMSPSTNALPTAHTCFNQLCLPEYDTYEGLVRALLMATNEGSEGFGLI